KELRETTDAWKISGTFLWSFLEYTHLPGYEPMTSNPEHSRLVEHQAGKINWQRWGPYLSERAWGTVREDYTADGDGWNYFPHDHARRRAYRCNEDGLGGCRDDRQHICLAVALWQARDAIVTGGGRGCSKGTGTQA